jgi:alanyl-tRNA synthetase
MSLAVAIIGLVGVGVSAISSASANNKARKSAELLKAETLAIANASALNPETLAQKKQTLIDQQKETLKKAIESLKRSSIKAWKDDIADMEKKLKDEDFSTPVRKFTDDRLITNWTNKKNTRALYESARYVNEFDQRSIELLGVIVAMKEKGVDNDGKTPTPEPEPDGRFANLQKYAPYAAAGAGVLLILKNRNS